MNMEFIPFLTSPGLFLLLFVRFLLMLTMFVDFAELPVKDVFIMKPF